MPKFIVDGEVVGGSTDFASAIKCKDADGNDSTVQAVLDEQNENLSELLPPKTITGYTVSGNYIAGAGCIIPIPLANADKYSIVSMSLNAYGIAQSDYNETHVERIALEKTNAIILAPKDKNNGVVANRSIEYSITIALK